MSDELPSALREDVEIDDEGLRRNYDVVISGTGLMQSILAAALARAGKSVMHCDAADFYGQLDAVWTFGYLDSIESYIEDEIGNVESGHADENDDEVINLRSGSSPRIQILSKGRKQSFPIQVGTLVTTRYGEAIVSSLPDELGIMEVELTKWKLADGSHPRMQFIVDSALDGSLEVALYEGCGVESFSSARCRTILRERSRSLALDATPRLIFADNLAVQSLLTSGVADYMEWKAVEGLFYPHTDTNKIERVPCNKSDVFTSKLLSPMDKRRLMKFLQLAMDYGTAQEAKAFEEEETEPESGVQSLNERHLNQGRSLSRPQNKTVATDDMEALEVRIRAGTSFTAYLKQDHRFSERMCDLIQYALALETGEKEASLQEGMTHLCSHMASLGRYGFTAFLVPLFGSGEIPQAFCRSAAVHGATYLLRRSPSHLRISKAERKVAGVFFEEHKELDSNEVTAAKEIACTHFVAPYTEASIESNQYEPSVYVVRRISVVRGKPICEGQQRHVVVFPPGMFDNEMPIQCLIVDEGVNVAPHVDGGCSVVHLTTSASRIPTSVEDSILARALDSVLNDAGREVEEIFHVSFYFEATLEVATHEQSIEGLHHVHQVVPQLTADPVFEQARQIFSKICPDTEFLTMTKAMTDAIEERVGDMKRDEDDEEVVLESAMGMLNTNVTQSEDIEKDVPPEETTVV